MIGTLVQYRRFHYFFLISNVSVHSTSTMRDILITTPNDEFLGSENYMISSHEWIALMGDGAVFCWYAKCNYEKHPATSTRYPQLTSIEYFE